MKLHVSLLKLLSFVLLLSLFGCEGNTDRERIIENNSSTSITVQAELDGPTPFNASIAPGDAETLFIGNQLGGSDFIEDPASGINFMIITNTSNDTLVKDFRVEWNWDVQVEHRRKVPSHWDHTYTFTVNDGDF